MHTLSTPSPWLALRKLRAQRGLGIDIGQLTTKIVSYVPGMEPEYACITIPTKAGLSNQNQVSPEEIAPAQLNLLTADGIRTPAVTGLSSTAEEHALDFSRWSAKQHHSLATRITAAVGRSWPRKGLTDVAISMAACDFRSLHLPPGEAVTPGSVRKKIQEATGDQRPRSVATVPSPKQESKVRVLSIPEELTEGLASKLDRQGLTPGRIEGVPWSLARVLADFESSENEIQLAVDWGFSQPTLVCVVDGRIDYIRRLGSGGIEELVAHCIAQFGLSRTEAIRWLLHCMSADRQAAGSDANEYESREWISACCKRLAVEINTAIEFIHWRNQGKKVREIHLTGGGPRMPGLYQRLQADLHINASVWERANGDGILTSEYAISATLAASREGQRGR